jgi:hypothetical protein
MLKLVDITLKITITDMFVIIDVQTKAHTQSIGIFMVYLHTQLHMPSFSGSLVMVLKPHDNTI